MKDVLDGRADRVAHEHLGETLSWSVGLLSAEDDEVNGASVCQPLDNISTFAVDDFERGGGALVFYHFDLLGGKLLCVLMQVTESLTIHFPVVCTESGGLEEGGRENDEENNVVALSADFVEVVFERFVAFWGVFPTD